MKYRLVNGDYVEVVISDSGRVQAIKYDKSGVQKMNTFNVSKDTTLTSNCHAVVLSDNSFIVVWLQNICDNKYQICLRKEKELSLRDFFKIEIILRR